MKKLYAQFDIPLDNHRGLKEEQKEEIEDLLRLAEDLDYIHPAWQIEFSGGGRFCRGETTVHIELSFRDAEFQGDVLIHGLRGALENTEEVQEVLDHHPGSEIRQLIINLFR
jgi:hypothetical protein